MSASALALLILAVAGLALGAWATVATRGREVLGWAVVACALGLLVIALR